MHTSQFRKIDTYDWFCGPGSHMAKNTILIFLKKKLCLKHNMIQVTCSLLKTAKTVIKTHLIPPVTIVTVKTVFICKAQKNILTGVLLQKK